MWKVVAFYTKNSAYEEHSKELIKSLQVFNIPYDVTPINPLGDWYKNMQYKPTFLQQMLEKHHPHSIIYVDADAVFCRYPEYFNKLDSEPDVNIAVHLLDHTKRRRKNHPPEMLSGTIFLKNTERTKEIVSKWIAECGRDSKLWDQVALKNVLRSYKFHLLPEEYCTIFDYMSDVKNPVIRHFQASRQEKNRHIKKAKFRGGDKNPSSNPRVVKRNGVIRIRRASHFI